MRATPLPGSVRPASPPVATKLKVQPDGPPAAIHRSRRRSGGRALPVEPGARSPARQLGEAAPPASLWDGLRSRTTWGVPAHSPGNPPAELTFCPELRERRQRAQPPGKEPQDAHPASGRSVAASTSGTCRAFQRRNRPLESRQYNRDKKTRSPSCSRGRSVGAGHRSIPILTAPGGGQKGIVVSGSWTLFVSRAGNLALAMPAGDWTMGRRTLVRRGSQSVVRFIEPGITKGTDPCSNGRSYC